MTNIEGMDIAEITIIYTYIIYLYDHISTISACLKAIPWKNIFGIPQATVTMPTVLWWHFHLKGAHENLVTHDAAGQLAFSHLFLSLSACLHHLELSSWRVLKGNHTAWFVENGPSHSRNIHQSWGDDSLHGYKAYIGPPPCKTTAAVAGQPNCFHHWKWFRWLQVVFAAAPLQAPF